jgi:hypothetical protein
LDPAEWLGSSPEPDGWEMAGNGLETAGNLRSFHMAFFSLRKMGENGWNQPKMLTCVSPAKYWDVTNKTWGIFFVGKSKNAWKILPSELSRRIHPLKMAGKGLETCISWFLNCDFANGLNFK